jgi:hypothetical protein
VEFVQRGFLKMSSPDEGRGLVHSKVLADERRDCDFQMAM